MATLLWLQTGSCGGDSLAILSADSPSLEQLLDSYSIELLWHPSLSNGHARRLDRVIDQILAGEQALDILCVEGSIITGPRGTGLYDPWRGGAKMNLVRDLAAKAGAVVAMGTCAAYGGIHAAPPNPSDCTGLQFDHEQPGGLLGPGWRSRSGMPVINVAGCPAHPHAMTQTLAALAAGLPLELDAIHRPVSHFSTMVHQGCTRNEYHEYNIEDSTPGGKACMFFNLGCQGPLTRAVCNTDLWNGVSSKTRAGVPCFGCTSPNFPHDGDLFSTEKIGDVPIRLPLGVERPRYMAYKNLARSAAPPRVRNKKMEP
ncbi:NADH ubiquinone oxidoreductase 20 kDa subunit [Leptothrix cholodnii SP-6]|uniref:hydrogenase (acceptor) n=1 Tax=Leptothrix cholodnii (strain ATCC 51168 / LMG 8142 / SP-6) TaxID=395495 RepID=B1Y6B2_LEPCP|nr:NADH ubiquinone oxidoreductase [Leptothrix cholodnii]ACB33617.1 NADH ubiquinone oxidoreductase 20 kDa subunit [Leptothrix cholodnii SP-6]